TAQGAPPIIASDHTAGNDSSDLHDILAELTGPRFRGFASAGVFGDVGTSLGLLTARNTGFHSIKGETEIGADPAFVNLFAFPVHVYSDFVLDGGGLFVVGDPGSYASYRMTLFKNNFIAAFFTSGLLEVDSNGNGTFSTA